MKKKILTTLVAITVAGTMLAGCGKKDEGTTTKAGETTTAAQQETTTDAPIGTNSKLKKLAEYKGLECEKSKAEVTDDAIKSMVDGLATTYATVEEKKGTIKNGDTVNIDFEGKIDGKAFQGGSATAYDLTIGSGSFIAGFETGLVGKKTGEKTSLNLKFPDDYTDSTGQKSEYAGKAVVFDVTINFIKVTTNAKVDDALIKDKLSYTGAKTLDEYKTWLKENARNYQIYNAVWNGFISKCDVESYGEEDIKTAEDKILKNFEEQLKTSYGEDFKVDDYKKQQNITDDKWKEMLESSARSSIKEKLIIEAIAEKENMKITDEEYKTELANYALQAKMDKPEEFETKYGKDEVELYIYNDRIMKLLAENIKIVDDPETTTAAK